MPVYVVEVQVASVQLLIGMPEQRGQRNELTLENVVYVVIGTGRKELVAFRFDQYDLKSDQSNSGGGRMEVW